MLQADAGVEQRVKSSSRKAVLVNKKKRVEESVKKNVNFPDSQKRKSKSRSSDHMEMLQDEAGAEQRVKTSRSRKAFGVEEVVKKKVKATSQVVDVVDDDYEDEDANDCNSNGDESLSLESDTTREIYRHHCVNSGLTSGVSGGAGVLCRDGVGDGDDVQVGIAVNPDMGPLVCSSYKYGRWSEFDLSTLDATKHLVRQLQLDSKIGIMEFIRRVHEERGIDRHGNFYLLSGLEETFAIRQDDCFLKNIRICANHIVRQINTMMPQYVVIDDSTKLFCRNSDVMKGGKFYCEDFCGLFSPTIPTRPSYEENYLTCVIPFQYCDHLPIYAWSLAEVDAYDITFCNCLDRAISGLLPWPYLMDRGERYISKECLHSHLKFKGYIFSRDMVLCRDYDVPSSSEFCELELFFFLRLQHSTHSDLSATTIAPTGPGSNYSFAINDYNHGRVVGDINAWMQGPFFWSQMIYRQPFNIAMSYLLHVDDGHKGKSVRVSAMRVEETRVDNVVSRTGFSNSHRDHAQISSFTNALRLFSKIPNAVNKIREAKEAENKYELVHNFITDLEATEILGEIRSKGLKLLGNFSSQLERNNNRKFAKISSPKLQKQFPHINNLHNAMVEVVKFLPRELRLSEPTMLASFENCSVQTPHTDFPVDTESNTCEAEKSLIFIIALMDGTRIFLGDPIPHMVEVPKYSLLIIRGDGEHAGASYDQENFRLHWNVDSGHSRENNATYI